MTNSMNKSNFNENEILDNYLLDSNVLVIFSPYGLGTNLKEGEYKKLYKFVNDSLLKRNKRFYITSFIYFEIMRNLENEDMANHLNMNLDSNVIILPTKFEKELYYIIKDYREGLISYEICMEKLLIEVKKKLSEMLYYFVITYLAFHFTIIQLLEMKSNMTKKMETQLIEKYSNYGKSILSKEFEECLFSECEELVNKNYPDGSSKNEINYLVLNTLKKFGLNGDYEKIINKKLIGRFNKKYPEAEYDFETIRYCLYDLHKIMPINNFETLNSFLIEKLTLNNHMIEFNDFIDLYNICLITNDVTFITLEKKWVDFLNEKKKTLGILDKSSQTCNEFQS